jgi:O-6-methylguanine DNA methyltransferase
MRELQVAAPIAFRARVLAAVRRIPPGCVLTYGDVAILAGTPRAWRAVGNIMGTCTGVDVPCHRVVASGGRLGGYGGNMPLKRALLVAEGLCITGTRIRDWRQARWNPPVLARARNAKTR